VDGVTGYIVMISHSCAYIKLRIGGMLMGMSAVISMAAAGCKASKMLFDRMHMMLCCQCCCVELGANVYMLPGLCHSGGETPL